MDEPNRAKPHARKRDRSHLPLVVLLLLAAGVLLVLQWRRPGRSSLTLGQPLPPLTVAGWLNTTAPPSAADLRGNVVLVDCWASWCGPCVANMPEVIEFYRQYHDPGVIVIGLTTEQGPDLQPLKSYVSGMAGLEWPIGYGAMVPMDMLGVEAIPTYILFDRSGRSVWSGHSFYGLEDAVLRSLAVE